MCFPCSSCYDYQGLGGLGMFSTVLVPRLLGTLETETRPRGPPWKAMGVYGGLIASVVHYWKGISHYPRFWNAGRILILLRVRKGEILVLKFVKVIFVAFAWLWVLCGYVACA